MSGRGSARRPGAGDAEGRYPPVYAGTVHPIEHLRYVARTPGVPQEALVRETAGALMSFSNEPAGLVTTCRRLTARQPSSGPLLWLASRVLTATDPPAEIRACVQAMADDDTARLLARELPLDGTVSVLGWPDLVGGALRRRGDLRVLVVDVLGEGHQLVRRLSEQEGRVEEVAETGLGAAAASSDVVLVESAAVGPEGFWAVSGSRAAAAVAQAAGIPVWLVAGQGAVLPEALWRSLVQRVRGQQALEGVTEAWDAPEEVVPLALVDQVAGPEGLTSVAEAVAGADCPVAPELFAADG